MTHKTIIAPDGAKAERDKKDSGVYNVVGTIIEKHWKYIVLKNSLWVSAYVGGAGNQKLTFKFVVL